MVQPVESGQQAMDRHAWEAAIEHFTAADREQPLTPADLEQLGAASWWAGQPSRSTEALERAFAGHLEAGEAIAAARVAMALAYQSFRRQAGSIGGGWLARAQDLLADQPDSAMHARLLVYHALGALMASRIAEGIDLADQAMASARKHGDRNVLFMAMSFKGMAEVFRGEWQTGLALIDEAAAAASSGELDLRVASDIYCNTIAACRNAGDYQRAGQWAEEGERWMQRHAVGGYPGICRVHRAELNMLRGRWPEADQEAREACDELQRFGLLDAVGYAHYQIGEVRLRMGDLDAAGEAFDRAYEYGHDAQPGLALLHLARGQTDAATRSITRAVAMTDGDGGSADRATRARLLPAQIDIALAAHDLVTAGRAVAELESIAHDFQAPVFEAGALTARGELFLGEERPAEASPLLGRSWRLWQASDLPYESARARLHYAEAIAAEGDTESARRDLRAARSVFERLGARIDLLRADALLGGGTEPSATRGQRLTRTFMFTDIVRSTDLIGLIGDEAWEALLDWHDRELRSAFAEHGGEEVNSTGDGFFVAFEQPAHAIECAMDIQRRLRRHRREHGFALDVRIGLHAVEATRRGRSYQGRGVHVAARIGAAAGPAEILVSSATIAQEADGRFAVSNARTLTLKGVAEPVEVLTVDWR
jgi:class 3 adenylate cyclase